MAHTGEFRTPVNAHLQRERERGVIYWTCLVLVMHLQVCASSDSSRSLLKAVHVMVILLEDAVARVTGYHLNLKAAPGYQLVGPQYFDPNLEARTTAAPS